MVIPMTDNEATDLRYGDEVVIPWGIDEVHGTVHNIYGSPPNVRVVVRLTPELTGSVVDEPTTVTVPAERIKRVEPAA